MRTLRLVRHCRALAACPKAAQPRGTVLIVAVGVMIVLTGLVLIFSRQMRVEALASGNLVVSAQTDALVAGAAQYVANRLANNQDRTMLDSEILAEAVPLGDGYFWILRPNPDDERQYAFGVVDESSKLNINSADLDALLRLPAMTPELAASIVDWRDPDSVVGDGGGAESEYYLLQPQPYYCKNAPFETLDELLLVKGAARELLYGVDANRNGVVDDDEAGTQTRLTGFSGQVQCGLTKYLTVYSLEPNPARNGPLLIGRINVNTAPREVLRCLPGLTDGDVDLLIAKRSASGPDLANVSWVAKTLKPATVQGIASRITTRSFQFSADIVAVLGNGRGFKRVKYVFDVRSLPPRLMYRQDLTHYGWPLDAALLEALRSASPIPVSSANTFSLERR
ncbi:MAG: type II secretion system protein GspK [Planctomycetota bacterium]|nr:type II secretion system protein GspK [Planctomycetota bacterium]